MKFTEILTTITEGAFKSAKSMSPKAAHEFMQKHYPGVQARRATDEAHDYVVNRKVVATYDALAEKLYIKITPDQL